MSACDGCPCCALVERLLADLARCHGTTVAAERARDGVTR